METIFFRNADKTFVFPDKKGLKQFIELLFKKEKRTLLELTYVFCSDEYLLGINKDFSPKFLRRYHNLFEEITKATQHYIADVKGNLFPNETEQY